MDSSHWIMCLTEQCCRSVLQQLESTEISKKKILDSAEMNVHSRTSVNCNSLTCSTDQR